MQVSEDTMGPEAVAAGFESRVDALFRAESGKPLVRAAKRQPLGPGRGNYVRHYSYSMMAFAARCLYLNEMLEEANAALAENAQHYLDHPKDINDRDSFHWHGEIVLRLVEMYGSRGTRHPGRISPQTEELALQPIFDYVRKCSWLEKAEYEKSRTWHIYSSENHHVMDFTIHWHFSKLARGLPEYRTATYDAGGTPAQHFAAWDEYFRVYCLERARKGLCVEMMSNHYNTVWLKGLYNFHDFGDPAVSAAAAMLIDLYLTYWAQEQIDGVQGGGRSRVYFDEAFGKSREHDMRPIAWLYFGIGEQPTVSGHELAAALSDYRAPAVVADIALDVHGRGSYEVRQRPQGLGEQGRSHPQVAEQRTPSKLRTDGGGILRYSFCDPAFILGTPMTQARPTSDWAAISAQNRWQGAIFAGPGEGRIVPLPRPENRRTALNQFWSVQSKGSLITQKLKHHRGAAEMLVQVSKNGLSEPVEEDGVVFVEACGAYAAIRVARGGFHWEPTPHGQTVVTHEGACRPPGTALILDDEWSPVILEVMAKREIESFAAFRQRVLASQPSFRGSVLSYRTIYGDQLTLDTQCRDVPTINGEPVNYAPKRVFDSPFLCAEYDSGVVTIQKGNRTRLLDFTAPEQCAPHDNRVTIGLIGDSTVAVQSGWGPALHARLDESIRILNYAVNGATLKSLSPSLDALLGRKPDYVLIQFGHNDQKQYGPATYRAYLYSYVERVKEAGSTPIVVSSLTRRTFDAQGRIESRGVMTEKFTFHAPLIAYADAARAVAAELSVPFLDLHGLSIAHHNALGPEASMAYNFAAGDTTHLNAHGAQAVAGLVLPELIRIIPELRAPTADPSTAQ